MLLAIKYNEDDYYSNEFYAKVGGISLGEINVLEAECCKILDFRLFVEDEMFNKYKDYIQNY
jgi:hypothetical protein